MPRIPTAELNRLNRILLDAERAYTQAAYSRALAALEAFPPDDPEIRFRRAGVTHALAELRGDLSLLDHAIREYEAILSEGRLHPKIASLMPALIDDAKAQRKEAMGL